MAKSPLLSPLDSISIDHALVIIANLINLTLIALFLSHPLKLARLEYTPGLFLSALVLPLIPLAAFNSSTISP